MISPLNKTEGPRRFGNKQATKRKWNFFSWFKARRSILAEISLSLSLSIILYITLQSQNRDQKLYPTIISKKTCRYTRFRWSSCPKVQINLRYSVSDCSTASSKRLENFSSFCSFDVWCNHSKIKTLYSHVATRECTQFRETSYFWNQFCFRVFWISIKNIIACAESA